MIGKILWLLVALLLARVQLAEAQQPANVPRVGYLTAKSPSAVASRTEAFRGGAARAWAC